MLMTEAMKELKALSDKSDVTITCRLASYNWYEEDTTTREFTAYVKFPSLDKGRSFSDPDLDRLVHIIKAEWGATEATHPADEATADLTAGPNDRYTIPTLDRDALNPPT